MPMIECREQAEYAATTTSIAKDIPGHIPDAADRKVLGLDVPAEFAEVALHRFPGAAGCDAHFLVIVAGRAARGEGIAQPE